MWAGGGLSHKQPKDLSFLVCIALTYFLTLSLQKFQAIDLITSMFENNFPVRFGVILYSTKFIQKLEMSGGDLPSLVGDGSQVEDDLSSLVITPPLYSFVFAFSSFKTSTTYVCTRVSVLTSRSKI